MTSQIIHIHRLSIDTFIKTFGTATDKQIRYSQRYDCIMIDMSFVEPHSGGQDRDGPMMRLVVGNLEQTWLS